MADLKLTADPDLVGHIIQARYGGIVGAMDEWSARYLESGAPGNPLPNKSSFYRWQDGGLPTNIHDLFRWASVLDVDPIALIQIPKNDFTSFARAVTLKFASFTLKGSLSKYIGQLFMPSHLWPPNDLVRKPFGYPWYVQELKHDPLFRVDFDACIYLNSSGWDGIAPRTYHFSYRRDIPEEPFWTPYGSVIRDKETVRLYHSSAYSREKPAPPIFNPAIVATYFGRGPAAFRIASLHPFEAKVGEDVALDKIVSF
jgi:hypothetical protein